MTAFNAGRRKALFTLVSTGLAAAWTGCSGMGRSKRSPWYKADQVVSKLESISPIDRVVTPGSATGFTGDEPHHAHGALWAKQAFIEKQGGLPTSPQETHDLVIIGGGVSGLMSAFLLRDEKPLVLEQASRFGGNAKGEDWDGLSYPLGAAYFVKPDAGSDWEKLLQDIGADKIWQEKSTEDPVEFKGRLVHGFWDGATAPLESREQFKKLAKFLMELGLDKADVPYPDLPCSKEDEKKLLPLDRYSLHEYVSKRVGGTLHPHLQTLIEQYCWSSFGASSTEVSAAHGLNFLTEEFEDLVVLPGGNAGVSELLLKQLEEALPASHLRTGALVVDVHADSTGVNVTYAPREGGREGGLVTVRAKTVVMSCPKFVVAKILRDIEPTRAAAIARLKYRSYLVANVLLNTPPPSDTYYDLFLLGQGQIKVTGTREISQKRGATDVVLANFSSHGVNDRTVLTLYRALPFDGARPFLYAPAAYPAVLDEFTKQISKEILPLLGYSQKQVVDLRLSRWGHPLPVAEKGLLTDGVLTKVRADFKDKVFFVEQDNWAQPAIECAAAEALSQAPRVAEYLKQVRS